MLTRSKLSELRRTKLEGPNRLRQAMKLAEITQVQLSERMGLSQSQISEDMNGKFSDLSLTKARAYADLFGCTVDDLFPREAVA